MPGLAAAQVSLADYPTGLNVVVFDIDPSSYDPFNTPIRGTSTKVLDGTVVHQVFGVQQADFVLNIRGQMTDYSTMKAVWTKFRQGGGGQKFLWTDWFVNQFVVVFTPGVDSFHPVPIIGSNDAHEYTLSLSVLSVAQWFGGAY